MKTHRSNRLTSPAVLLAAGLALALPGAARAGSPAPAQGGEHPGHNHANHAATLPAPPPAAGSVDARAAFERIKKLAGDWQGTLMAPDGAATSTRLEVTAGGNAVLEKLFAGTDHEMVNVYHMQGSELMVTHYCDSGNQPLLRYSADKSSPDLMVFDFAGGANLDPAKDAHIHAARIALQGEDRMESDWDGYAGGKKEGGVKFLLSRRR